MESTQHRDNGEARFTTWKRGSSSHALSARQELFAMEYFKDLNASQVSIRAGYVPRSAEVAGSRLLRNAKAAAAIDMAMNARSPRVDVSQDCAIQAIASGCFWDRANVFHEDGLLKQIREMDFDTRKAIAGFEVVEVYKGERDRKQAFGRLNKIKLVGWRGTPEH